MLQSEENRETFLGMKTAMRRPPPLPDQGDAAAQFNLGVMYENGEGVPQDYAAALTGYRRAADQGHAGAHCNLGVFYEQGLGGLPKDDREAARLFKLAMSFAPSHLRRRRLGQ